MLIVCPLCALAGKPVGESILYFGCRYQKEDFIYEEELKEFLKDGSLTTIYTAFSRDQKEKVYVQHLLANHKEEVWKVLDAGGHLYVCG